jgi:FMN phosphatase YigB (HAD superfamily)
MIHLVFDLDFTLYQTPVYGEFDYSMLEEKQDLSILLESLPFNKIIFTNGTFGHAIKCLELMNLRHHFPDNKIVARDTMNDFKPSRESFMKCIEAQNIKENDKVFFFEDTVENLVESKSFGWITFFIGPVDLSYFKTIDKSYKNIEEALKMILKKYFIVYNP